MPTLHTHGKRGVTRRTAIKTATLAAGWEPAAVPFIA